MVGSFPGWDFSSFSVRYRSPLCQALPFAVACQLTQRMLRSVAGELAGFIPCCRAWCGQRAPVGSGCDDQRTMRGPTIQSSHQVLLAEPVPIAMSTPAAEYYTPPIIAQPMQTQVSVEPRARDLESTCVLNALLGFVCSRVGPCLTRLKQARQMRLDQRSNIPHG